MGILSRLFGNQADSRAFRTIIDSNSVRLSSLTEFNNHDRCLALLIPSVKFAQDNPSRDFKRLTSDACVFELVAYIVFSTDLWHFTNRPDLRDKIQGIISKQVAALCSRSGLLTEEETFEYMNRRLAAYGGVISEGGDAQALHLRLQQALLYAANHTVPQHDTMDKITIYDAFSALNLTKELIDWDMLRMKLMGSILPRMD